MAVNVNHCGANKPRVVRGHQWYFVHQELLFVVMINGFSLSVREILGFNAIKLKCCRIKKEYNNNRCYWYLVNRIGGEEQVVTIGVTQYQEDEISTEDSMSLKQSFETSMAFEAGSASGIMTYGLTTQQSQTVTERSLSAVTQTMETNITVGCDNPATIYQFVCDTDESGVNTNTFTFQVKSRMYLCVSQTTSPPQCPWGYCSEAESDPDCQKLFRRIYRTTSFWKL
eukprot:TRINITY_DN1235_c0_g1_i1.p1 TRINITY_DN1235_c0_g1~~TRINITY_DN1235_c0_g1_i1.p1  ORF type:complete len:242 (+),score=62.67 TRINITY_DN1235_c0_g1_i1:48-728(+)